MGREGGVEDDRFEGVVWLSLIGSSAESVSGSDNRDITDDGASQELTEENIAQMKGQGASGKVPVHVCPHD